MKLLVPAKNLDRKFLFINKRPVMKYLFLLITFYTTSPFHTQQHTPLPHGMIFGSRPDTTMQIAAWRIEDYMGKRVRMSTTLRGRITKVIKTKGGWFELDAGKGKIIDAHFKNMGVNIPADLKGKIVLIEGVAQKKFIADDLQHYAGDTVVGKKQHQLKTNPLRRMTFEVKGLMVYQ